MGDEKSNRDGYFAPGAAAFNYNNVTGGADSASGGSGGSGMECMQLRSPPGPFQFLISEQAKSLVALQELQNEVGALLEFRDLVIETFPNLRSKMAPSTPASTRREWEPGVRVRRKLAGGDQSGRTKPQPSVQDSGFSTETSCGKDAHSSASATASTSRCRPIEDELWALLDVIQRKGVKLRDEAELLRGELDERGSETAEDSFARALSSDSCSDTRRLRVERDLLLAHAARAAAEQRSPLGRLDAALQSPLPLTPKLPKPDSEKFAAILQESNPVELQRQLLTTTVQNQVLYERLKRVAAHRSLLHEKLERAKEVNEDLKFRLEEKTVELEGARQRAVAAGERGRRSHSSMRELEPLALPAPGPGGGGPAAGPGGGGPAGGPDTPRRRPSRIPLHTAHKGTAPRPPPRDNKKTRREKEPQSVSQQTSLATHAALFAEYISRTERAARHPLFSRLPPVRARPLPANLNYIAYESPQNLAMELSKSILYENVDSIDKTIQSVGCEDSLWNGKPQQYFESMNYGAADGDIKVEDYEVDSLAP